MNFDELGHVAEIGADGDFYALGAEGQTDGIGGIVGDGEGVDVDIADGEVLACFNFFHAAQAFGESVGEDAVEGVEGRFGGVERSFPEAENLREADAVIGVFVSDEDSVEIVEIAIDGGRRSRSARVVST